MGGMIVVPNERNELFPIRTMTIWRVCMDYRKWNASIVNDHFPMPFMQLYDILTRKKRIV